MQKILGRVRRAIEDFSMIETGDEIAVGVSGGKDSLTLLCALAQLSRFYPKKFSVTALTIDMGLPGGDFRPVTALCEELSVPHIIKKTNIGEILFEIRKEKNPCSLCAKMRRGILSDLLRERGIEKIALGHHTNDAVETFFLSLFYEGRIHCFQPVTYLDRTGVTQIRPLLYVEEREIEAFAKRQSLPVCKNPCPANGFTQRQAVKDYIAAMEKERPGFQKNIFGAIRRSKIPGWDFSSPLASGPGEEESGL